MPRRKSHQLRNKAWIFERALIAIIGLIAFFVLVGAVNAYVGVKGYLKNNGTYVQPYRRSDPNPYKFDNYSSRGNTNPWTGKRGYKK